MLSLPRIFSGYLGDNTLSIPRSIGKTVWRVIEVDWSVTVPELVFDPAKSIRLQTVYQSNVAVIPQLSAQIISHLHTITVKKQETSATAE